MIELLNREHVKKVKAMNRKAKMHEKEKAVYTDAKGREYKGELGLTTHGPKLWNWHFSNWINKDCSAFVQLGNHGCQSRDHALADAERFNITSKSIENLL